MVFAPLTAATTVPGGARMLSKRGSTGDWMPISFNSVLIIAGLELDTEGLRGPLGRLAGIGFAVSAALGLGAGFLFWAAGQETRPILLGIIVMSTSAGLLLPLLKDAGEAATEYGQLIMTAAALAEIVPILLLSLLFSAPRSHWASSWRHWRSSRRYLS
ncbi:MAG TPA: cation:proton antiporter [Trebonia sp.]